MLVQHTWEEYSGVSLRDLDQVTPNFAQLHIVEEIDDYYLGRFQRLTPYYRKAKVRAKLLIYLNFDHSKLFEDLDTLFPDIPITN